MMESQEQNSKSAPAGFAAAIGSLSRNFGQLFLTRVELASIEFAELRKNVLKLFLLSVFGMLAVIFAVAYWSILLVAVAWPLWGWKILLVIALAFTLIFLIIAWFLRALFQQNKFSLNATMAELRKDCDALL